LRLLALATGAADEAVQLAYERVLRAGDRRWPASINRLAGQITDKLAALEAEAPDLWPAGAPLGQPGTPPLAFGAMWS
jgi:hypothetical protein